jgi:hypothetical protein
MPLQIVNRELYANRTVQDWHRRVMPRDADAIDLDLMGVCRRSYCRDPLYFIEATTNPNKPATILRRLANKAGAFGIVVYHDTETITGFQVVADHNGMKHPQILSEDAGEALERLLTAIREDHDSRH